MILTFEIILLTNYILQLITDIVASIVFISNNQICYGVLISIFWIVPTIIVQSVSTTWYVEDFQPTRSGINIYGLISRYKIIISEQYKKETKSNVQLNELNILQFLNLFLETIPQLCLQLYAVIVFDNTPWLIYINISITLLSLLTYGLRYIYLQDESKPLTKYLQYYKVTWRLVTLTVRVTGLICLSIINQQILIYLITTHLMLAIIYFGFRKLRNVQSVAKRVVYSVIFAVLFLFDYFNIYERNRKKLILYYVFVSCENFIIIVSYGYMKSEWKIAITTLTTSLFLSAILIFIYCYSPIFDEYRTETKNSQKQRRTLQNLHYFKYQTENDIIQKLNSSTKVDDIEFHSIKEDESIATIPDLNSTISEVNRTIPELNTIPELVKPIPELNTATELNSTIPETESNLSQLKRRGICTSIELQPEIQKTPSEVMSTHDYENMCAVNINRELCGLRSWQGYLDIDAYLHDDSTVHDKRWDTLTTSSNSYDYPETESDTESLRLKPFIIDHMYPILGPLDTITEEGSEESVISLNLNSKLQQNSTTSISTLVATIDEIRLGNVNSPLECYFPSIDYGNVKATTRRNIFNSPNGLTLDQILFLSELSSDTLDDTVSNLKQC